MASIKTRIDTTQLETLAKLLGPRDFAREVMKGVRNGTRKIERMTGQAVAKRYNLSPKRFEQKTRVKTESHWNSLQIVYRGQRMRLAEFVTSKGPPITATVKDGGDLNERSFFISMHKKAGGNRSSLTQRHATKKERVDMVFTRQGESRYPIKALFTLAGPQMVRNAEVTEEVLDFAGEQLVLAAQKAVEKAIRKAGSR